jgi:deferrochelatase/peroxidase EfeB
MRTTASKRAASLPRFPKGNATHFSPGTFKAFLGAIQGNILQSHGREHARLVYFRFNDGGSEASYRKFLRDAASDWVVSAWKQREHTKAFKRSRIVAARVEASRRLFAGFALSRAGLAAIGRTTNTGSFPNFKAAAEPVSEGQRGVGHLAIGDSMRDGMKVNTDDTVIADWGPPFTKSPHGLWILACDDESALEQAVAKLAVWCGSRGAAIIQPIEKGIRLRDPKGSNREPFGFVDGISMPVFYTRERRRNPPSPWVDMTLNEAILPKDLSNSGAVAGGSYLAVLKIEQNVAAFRRYEEQVAAVLASADYPNARELAPALLMGRLRDGTPLIELMNGRQAKAQPGRVNQFDFEGDPAARGCPFHAHIRKMNPRVRSTEIGDTVAAQVVRRSMVFDDTGKIAAALSRGTGPWPDKGVGLLFMAYMTNPDTQFGTLHNSWAWDTAFPPHKNGNGQTDQRDSVLFGGEGKNWTWRGLTFPPVPRFLRRLGGDFFFVPSIPWLASAPVP